MIAEALDAVWNKWDERRQRPFWRMVYLFAARVFRGGGDSDADGLDLGIGLVLTLLAMPGGFVSLLLLNKYGTFLQWLRGRHKRRSVAGRASRRILLHRPVDDSHRRRRCLAMGCHLP